MDITPVKPKRTAKTTTTQSVASTTVPVDTVTVVAVPGSPIAVLPQLEAALMKMGQMKEALLQAKRDLDYAAGHWANTYVERAAKELGEKLKDFGVTS